MSRYREEGKVSILLTVVVAVLAIGAVVAVFSLAAARSGSGGSSISEKSFVGDWSAAEQQLSISAKGSASGTDGCNSQLSKWSYTDAQIRFAGFLGTKIACSGADGKFTQGWLSKSASASFKDGKADRLFFYDSKGKELGSMGRSTIEPQPKSKPTD